jgi:tryptophan-rich sensory protein
MNNKFTNHSFLTKEWQYQLLVIAGGYVSGILKGNLASLTTQLRSQFPYAWIPPNYIFTVVWTVLYIFYGSLLYNFFYAIPNKIVANKSIQNNDEKIHIYVIKLLK